MRDSNESIIYVGKAKDLQRRVRSYFARSPDSLKTAAMIANVARIEIMVTETEGEALLLEANLIKKHRPRYNISLRDSKRYPFLAISVEEDFPRLFKTRNTTRSGNQYFGPYYNVGIITHTIKLLHRLFPIRYCNRRLKDGETNGSVCFYFHIGRCLGPCEARINSREYKQYISGCIRFLEGRHSELIADLEKKMAAHARNLEYEQAAALRDQVASLREASQLQVIHRLKEETPYPDMDIFNISEEMGMAAFAVLRIREGKLIGQRLYVERHSEEKPFLFTQFFSSYLVQEQSLPPLILLPGREQEQAIQDLGLGESTLVTADSAACGPAMRKLLFHARRNAEQALQDEIRVQLFARGLEELGTLLRLDAPPVRIEGFDIATLGGEETVAGMVSFHQGRPDRKQYRRFIIRTVDGQDDVGSIREAVARRYQRLLNEGKPLPDLILIDGGKPQLNAARTVLEALGLQDQALAALAKKEELIFVSWSQEPIRLARNHFALRILQAVRDETHRYVNSFHARRRDKHRAASGLEQIPGIGPALRRRLLLHFGSLAAVRRAALNELESVLKNQSLAKRVRQHLQQDGNNG